MPPHRPSAAPARAAALVAAVLAALVCGAATARAQTFPGYDDPFGPQADLKFPLAPEPARIEKDPSKATTALFRPSGAGPFPALIVMPNCDGAGESEFTWATKAVANGYVALIVDPFTPRNVTDDCTLPQRVSWPRRLNDAFEAADHLRGLPFVMADRIALMGFSTGGMTGLEAASASSARYSQGRDFAAIVSFYPYCDVAQTKRRFLPALLAAPLLVLMGDLDTEMPPDTCRAPLNALKAAGQPIDWELYAGATHCWDCVQYRASGLRKRDWKGDPIEYRYNVDVTLASQDRAFAFLAKYLER